LFATNRADSAPAGSLVDAVKCHERQQHFGDIGQLLDAGLATVDRFGGFTCLLSDLSRPTRSPAHCRTSTALRPGDPIRGSGVMRLPLRVPSMSLINPPLGHVASHDGLRVVGIGGKLVG
jgi:hypothetical protein